MKTNLLTKDQYSELNHYPNKKNILHQPSLNSDLKIEYIISVLKNTVNDIPNDWTSKKREKFIFNRLLNLPFLEIGQEILKDVNLKKYLKSVYFGNNPKLFTLDNLKSVYDDIDLNKIYILHEPFGSNSSPDFLFITLKGIFGLEDKSSKNEKITFNTGTPGGNKIMMYYDKKNKIINLLTGKQWGWDQSIDEDYKRFTKNIQDYAKNEFKNIFGDILKNMEFYARPMLNDKNKVKNIVDDSEQDVIYFLKELI